MMAALRSVTDEREETQRDLAATQHHHTQLTHRIAELRLAGEPADSTYIRKLGWQLDACNRWINRLKETTP